MNNRIYLKFIIQISVFSSIHNYIRNWKDWLLIVGCFTLLLVLFVSFDPLSVLKLLKCGHLLSPVPRESIHCFKAFPYLFVGVFITQESVFSLSSVIIPMPTVLISISKSLSYKDYFPHRIQCNCRVQITPVVYLYFAVLLMVRWFHSIIFPFLLIII